MGLDLSDYSQSRFLAASDLEGPTVVTIRAVTEEEFDDGPAPVAWFHELKKGLPLNSTNRKAILRIFGKDAFRNTDRLTEKKVELFLIETEFRGEPCQGIRIRQPREIDLGERGLE